MDNNQEEYYRKLADKLAEECPNPDCICKNDAEPQYIITDKDMTDRLDEAYVQALIDRYGDVAELTSTVTDDDPDAPDYSDIDPEFYGYHPE